VELLGKTTTNSSVPIPPLFPDRPILKDPKVLLSPDELWTINE